MTRLKWPTKHLSGIGRALVEWLEDERIVLRNRLRLGRQAEDWDVRGREDSLLIRGALLTEALQYSDLNPLEQEFVNRSEEATMAAQREKEEAQRRELEQARQLAKEQTQRAEAEAKAAQRLRYFSVTLLVLMVAIILVVIGWINLTNQRTTAETQRIEAELLASYAEETAIHANMEATNLAEVSGATATAVYFERATSEAVATSQKEVDTNATATAINATATAINEAAIATQTVIAQDLAEAEAEPTSSSSSGATLPTFTPNPQLITAQLANDAQLKARIRPEDNMPMFFYYWARI